MRSLRRFLPYYRPYRKHVEGGLLLVIVSAALASVPPWLVRLGIDGIRAGEPLSRAMLLAARSWGSLWSPGSWAPRAVARARCSTSCGAHTTPRAARSSSTGCPCERSPSRSCGAEIGYVPQESFLFSDSIGHNLSYGAPHTESGVWGAQMAQLAGTIEAFPGAYDTMLGERGINLSGGQKQRAALTRVLARRPAFVLLDDALTAVDTHTEAAIPTTLRTALAGRTPIIASHRVSAIRDANPIIVLDSGRIVEQGTYEELFMLRGRYWSLLRRRQLEDSLEAPALAPVGGSGTIRP